MVMKDVINLTEKCVLKTYGRRKIAFEEGKGVTLYDLDGNEYLDFTVPGVFRVIYPTTTK